MRNHKSRISLIKQLKIEHLTFNQEGNFNMVAEIP